MGFDELKQELLGFLESDEGKRLVTSLGEQRKYLILAKAESALGYTPVYFIDGDGLKCSTVPLTRSADFTGGKQDVLVNADIDEAVSTIIRCIECIQYDHFLSGAAFMRWLKNRSAENGIQIPADNVAAA